MESEKPQPKISSESTQSVRPPQVGDEILNTIQSQSFVLIGIPAYNEVATIGEIVHAAQAYADEVFVVDDGSDDGTRDRARAAGATVLLHETNKGYGATLRSIFQYAHEREADHLVILDGDGQHDVGDVPDLVRTQQKTDAELVTGSRFMAGSSTNIPLYRQFGLAVINMLTNLGLRVGYSHPTVSDTQCGFRSYNSEAIKTLANTAEIGSGMGASLDILFQAAQEQYEIVEVPTRINYDLDETSTQNPVTHGFSLLQSLFLSLIRDRPVRIGFALTVMVLSSVSVVFALRQAGLTAVYLLVPALLTLVLVFSLTWTRRVSRSS